MDTTKRKNTKTSLVNNEDTLFTNIIILCALFVGSLILGQANFALFHTVVELFCALIAFMMFGIAINTYSINENDKIIFLGIAFGFIGIIDLLHLFTYKGMGVFSDDTANIPTQLWIMGRYLQSITLLISFTLPTKVFTVKRQFIIYSIVTSLLLTSVFFIGIFPDAYIDGLTSFKIISEYIICGILTISLIIFIKQRSKIFDKIDIFIIISLIMTIISELFFTTYISVFGFSNLVGHAFKLAAFYCLYIAIVKTSLKEPHYTLGKLNRFFNEKNRNLEKSFTELKKEYEQSERRKAEDIRKKEILNGILEASIDGILVISNDRYVVHANNKFMQMFEITFNIETNTSDFYLIDYVATLITNPKEFEKAITSLWKSQGGFTFYLNHFDGRIIEVSTLPFIDNGVSNGKVINFKDITEKLKVDELKGQVDLRQALLEKAREYDELKTNFFSNVTHELKDPLNIILGVVQLLSNGQEQETRSTNDEYTTMMKQNCYRLIKLANNLMDISKIDSGFMEPNLKNHNIIPIIEGITLSVGEFIKDKGISFMFDTNIQEKIMACDVYSIERLMLNLLSNAVKYTNSNGIIEVSVRDKKDYIEIAVRDNGIGFTDEALRIIKDKLNSVDTSLRRDIEGIGMGLSLVKSILDNHKGELKINSKEGVGSEFIISIPYTLVEEYGESTIYIPSETNLERINIEFSDIYEIKNIN
jgi:signal transduction histidine kinase